MLSDLEQSGSSSSGKVISLGQHLRRYTLWVLPLAAIMALAFLMPQGSQEKLLMQDLSVSKVVLMPDGTRGRGHLDSRDATLHTGQAFALDFSLNEDSFVVIYHVDPRGQISRVYPETITDDLVPLRGGQIHQIPSAESEEAWILGNQTGTESFLVAVNQTFPISLANLQGDPTLNSRSAILANLQAQLEAHASQVDLYQFEHVD